MVMTTNTNNISARDAIYALATTLNDHDRDITITKNMVMVMSSHGFYSGVLLRENEKYFLSWTNNISEETFEGDVNEDLTDVALWILAAANSINGARCH